jgi:hypothetical protein
MLEEAERRLASLEAKVADLERFAARLSGEWIPWVRDAVAGLSYLAEGGEDEEEEDGRPLPPKARRKRVYRRNWKDYLAMGILLKQGLSIRKAAGRLGLAYTTGHNYVYLSPGAAAELKAAWEDAFGPLDEAGLMRSLSEEP